MSAEEIAKYYGMKVKKLPTDRKHRKTFKPKKLTH